VDRFGAITQGSSYPEVFPPGGKMSRIGGIVKFMEENVKAHGHVGFVWGVVSSNRIIDVWWTGKGI
jgi:hypothetical protein